MRTFTILFVLLHCISFAQQPAIGTMTILPQVIFPNSAVTIVTKVTTPAQGVLVDKTFTVTQNPKRVELRLCYGFGMLPATQTYIDTFYVGALGAGTFSVHLKAYMSSANQHCAKIDSNEVTTSITVDQATKTTGSISEDAFTVFPVPAGEQIFIQGNNHTFVVELYHATGQLISSFEFTGTGEISLADLSPGLYLIRYQDSTMERWRRLIKH